MPVTVKPVTLWRKDVENRPGELARTLEPLARAGADLQVVMGYRYPGRESHAAIELSPVRGRKAEAAAQAAGLSAAPIPALQVEGDNRPGLSHAVSQALGEAGINMAFQVAQVVGRRFSAIFGFENEADARRAAAIVKKAATAGRRGR